MNTGIVPFPEEVLLTIHIDGKPVSRLSCSPFDYQELVIGWLYGQKLIERIEDIKKLTIKDGQADVSLISKVAHRLKQFNPVQVTACSGGDIPPRLFDNLPHISRSYDLKISQAICLMGAMSSFGVMFKKHGGIHCSMLAQIPEDKIWVAREDIGRSNSVDKVIGWGLNNHINFSQTALFTTGRISAEMALKAVHAGIPTLISQTTLTSKALEVVRQTGLTLIGHVLKPHPILLNF